jgi:hypothetical protein
MSLFRYASVHYLNPERNSLVSKKLLPAANDIGMADIYKRHNSYVCRAFFRDVQLVVKDEKGAVLGVGENLITTTFVLAVPYTPRNSSGDAHRYNIFQKLPNIIRCKSGEGKVRAEEHYDIFNEVL